MAAREPATARTAEELLLLPRGRARYELVRGELRESMPAGAEHGRLAMLVALSLGQHVRAAGIGEMFAAETGFRLADDHVRAPDVALVSRDRVEAAGSPRGYWPGAPDLAIEVLSPSDRYSAVEEKVADWLDAGTRLVVVVNPERESVTMIRALDDVRVLPADGVLDGGDVVPGWQLPVAEIFAR